MNTSAMPIVEVLNTFIKVTIGFVDANQFMVNCEESVQNRILQINIKHQEAVEKSIDFSILARRSPLEFTCFLYKHLHILNEPDCAPQFAKFFSEGFPRRPASSSW